LNVVEVYLYLDLYLRDVAVVVVVADRLVLHVVVVVDFAAVIVVIVFAFAATYSCLVAMLAHKQSYYR